MHGFGRRLHVLVVGAHDAGRALAPDLDLGVDALGGQLLHVSGVALEDVVGILVRDEPHGDLGGGLRRNDSLCARSGEASGHAVHFERWTSPCAVED